MSADSSPRKQGTAYLDEFEVITQRLRSRLEAARGSRQTSITVSYAQSIDGCIATDEGCTTRISNHATQSLCHHIRSLHQGILVGINTVKVDNPMLNVRLVDGASPRPIILDSRLSIPREAAILELGLDPIIATTQGAGPDRERQLSALGVEVLRLGSPDDSQVPLPLLFAELQRRDICTVMVEGGATVNTELYRERLLSQVFITVAPRIFGGLRSVGDLSDRPPDLLPELDNVHYHVLAGDLLIYGELV